MFYSLIPENFSAVLISYYFSIEGFYSVGKHPLPYEMSDHKQFPLSDEKVICKAIEVIKIKS